VKAFFDLRISGLGLNIHEITDRLKITPDYAYNKGDTFVDKKHGGEITYKEDCWIAGYEANENRDLDEELEYFVTKLKFSADYLKSLAEHHNVTIWVSTYPENEQANIHITLPTIIALGEIGATLDCSMVFLKEFYDGKY